MTRADVPPGWLTRLRSAHARVWASRPRTAPAEEFELVVVKPDGIGDFVLATGAIHALLRAVPADRLAMVVSEAVLPLARREFPQVRLIGIPPFLRHKRALHGWRRIRRTLSRISARDVLCLRHQRWDYHELVLGWIGAERRWVIDDPAAAFWTRGRNSYRCREHVRSVEPPASEALIPRELALHRELLAAFLGRVVAAEELLPRIGAGPADRPRCDMLVAPFTAAAIKDLPVGLLHPILAEGTPITLIGSPEQQERLSNLARHIRSKSAARVQVAAPDSLADLIERLAAAPLILTADTATAHLATALDCRTVVVMGGGHPGQFGPWRRSPRQRWLTHEVPCAGCGWSCPHPEPYCLTRIAPSEVQNAMDEVLAAP